MLIIEIEDRKLKKHLQDENRIFGEPLLMCNTVLTCSGNLIRKEKRIIIFILFHLKID